MSITEQPKSKQYTPRPAEAHHESKRDYGAGIAMTTGALGAAVALAGVALGSVPVLVAAVLLLGAWGFLMAANRSGK